MAINKTQLSELGWHLQHIIDNGENLIDGYKAALNETARLTKELAAYRKAIGALPDDARVKVERLVQAAKLNIPLYSRDQIKETADAINE